MKIIKQQGLALLIGVATTLGASAKDVVLSLDQANTLARNAFIAKDYKTAHTLAYGVLQQRPNDPNALIIAAATDPSLGHPKRGREAGFYTELITLMGLTFAQTFRFRCVQAVKLVLAVFLLIQ